MTVKEIVIKYLKRNKYNGLFTWCGCSCEMTDLMPCDGDSSDCEAGYKVPCDCTDGTVKCDFHIAKKRNKGE